MKDFDIALYGHLSFDRIFNDFKEVNSVGCMANVWHHLISLDPKLRIHLAPISLGEAVIYVDSSQSKRASVANLNLKTLDQPSLVSSKWHHILYLNELPQDLKWVDDIPEEEIVSADVCKGKAIDLPALSRVDYLFISDEDMFHTVDELTSHVRGWVIMHHKSGSICSNGETSFKINVETLSGINVLGAGDMFAGSVIRLLNKNEKIPFKDIIKQAHIEVKSCLKRK